MVQIKEFKAALGKFPTGVTVISTNSQGNFFGFTANSFTSVSLSPMLVSFCLNKTSGSFVGFSESENFAINILAGDQVSLAKHFASSAVDKFSAMNHELSEEKIPLIPNAICWVECTKYKQIECGDHHIFIGEVKKTKINNHKPPLLYFAKEFQELT